MSFVKCQGLGQNLLAEVEEESLHDLLVSLRELASKNSSNPKSSVGIPVLDSIVNCSGIHKPGPSRGPVVEITSTAPASGKTQFLYLLIAAATLPTPARHADPDKAPGAVVVVDADGTFNVDRLRTIMLAQLTQSNSAIKANRAEVIVQNALRHVHIFHPQSFPSLVATVEHLPEYLLTVSNHFSQSRSLDLLIIDSMSAFFWQQNFAEETAAQDREKKTDSLDDPRDYSDLVQNMRRTQRTFDCAIVTTQWGLSRSYRRSSTHLPTFRSLLPSSWQSFCTMQILLERDKVKRFPPGITVDQALNEADDRQAVIDQARFTGWVVTPDVDRWDDTVQEYAKSHLQGRSFTLRVTPNDVILLS